MKWNSGRLWLKISVYGLLLFAALLTTILTLYFSRFDPEGARQSLERSLADTGRTLKINGDISPLLLPSPGLRLSNINLSEKDGKTTFASIASAEARLAWLPLLFGRLEITHLDVEGASIRLVRATDGTLNITDMLQRKQQSRFSLNLDSFRLQIGRLDYQDRFNGQLWRLAEAQLDTRSLHDDARMSLHGHLQVAGRSIELHAEAPFTRIDDQIDVPDLRITASNNSKELGEIKASGSGKLQLNLATMLAQGQQLKLAVSSSKPAGQSELLLPTLSVSLDELSAPSASLTGSINYQKTRYSFSSHFSQINARPGLISASKTHHDFAWQIGKHSLSMALQSPFQLTELSNLQMSPISLTAQLRTPLLPRGQLRANLQGELDGKLDQATLGLRVSGDLDGSRLAASIKQNGFLLPEHEITLSVDKLDLNRYLPENKVASSVALFDNDQPLNLNWMDYVRVNGKINVGELGVGSFRIGGISADVGITPEQIKLDNLSADIYEGQLQGQASLQRDKLPSLTVRQQLTGMQIKPLMQDLFDFGRIEGAGNGWVQLEAKGSSMRALRDTLSGDVAARLEKGALTGIDLVETLQNLPGSSEGWNGQVNDAPDQRTTFSALAARFQLTEGIARNNDLQLSSSLVNANGSGKFDLTQGLVDYKLDVRPNQQAFSKLGKVNIPLKITGPVGKPVYSLDFNAIVKGKTSETEKQQTLKQELGKQLNAILPKAK